MRKLHNDLVASAAAALIVLAAAAAESRADVKLEFMTARCFTGDEIAADTRAVLEGSALRFVRTILGANPESAHAAFTSEAKQAISIDGLATLVQQSIQPWAPFKNVHITQVHFVTITAGGYDGRTVCGNLARPEDRVTAAVTPVPKQAHVIVEAENINNSWTFVMWLIPEPDWRVRYFHFAMAGMVGKSAQDIWGLAREEKRQNHHFNATILYRAANTLADRGESIQLGIQPESRQELNELEVPGELSGELPATWTFRGNEFEIVGIEPLGVGGKIYLSITQETARWSEDTDADRHNRRLISEFVVAFPEYSTAFAGLIVGARERGGNRLYRTVDENQRSPD